MDRTIPICEMKRSSNIFAAVVALLWLGVFLSGRDLVYGIYLHGRGVAPSAEQIDSGIVLPLVVVLALGACAWLVNALNRYFPMLATISYVALFALLPFMLMAGGGV